MKENLELLAKRFDAMALAREDVAAKKKWSNCERESVAMVPLESVAWAYRRCASEARMLAAGATPPPPGMRWDNPIDESQEVNVGDNECAQ